MRRALAVKKMRWRRQLLEAKKRKRIQAELERPPTRTSGRKIGKDIFNQLSNDGDDGMTKKSMLRKIFDVEDSC